MSDRSAAFAEIETADAAPAAEPSVRPPVVDTTAAPVATPDTVAANEDSFGKAALEDDTVSPDLYNDGGSVELTADQKATKALKEWSVPGEWNIGGNGGGPLSKQDLSERIERKREEELDELFESIKEAHAQQEKDAEYARKWENELHEVGGHKFTGQKLLEMRDWMQDEKNQDQFEDELMKREGISKEEAKKRRQKLQEFLELKKKEHDNGGRLTPEERRRMGELSADPQVGSDAQVVTNSAKQNAAQLEKTGIHQKSDDDYTGARKSINVLSTADQVVAEKAASTKPAYIKPDADAFSRPDEYAFSASENLISSDRLTPTYNHVASQTVATLKVAEPEVKTTVAAIKPIKLENTVEVNGFG